jgi:hypothetical protein
VDVGVKSVSVRACVYVCVFMCVCAWVRVSRAEDTMRNRGRKRGREREEREGEDRQRNKNSQSVSQTDRQTDRQTDKQTIPFLLLLLPRYRAGQTNYKSSRFRNRILEGERGGNRGIMKGWVRGWMRARVNFCKDEAKAPSWIRKTKTHTAKNNAQKKTFSQYCTGIAGGSFRPVGDLIKLFLSGIGFKLLLWRPRGLSIACVCCVCVCVCVRDVWR